MWSSCRRERCHRHDGLASGERRSLDRRRAGVRRRVAEERQADILVLSIHDLDRLEPIDAGRLERGPQLATITRRPADTAASVPGAAPARCRRRPGPPETSTAESSDPDRRASARRRRAHSGLAASRPAVPLDRIRLSNSPSAAGDAVERVFANERAAGSLRQANGDLGQVGLGGHHTFVGAEHFAGFIETQTVAREQPLQPDRQRPQSDRLRRRSPLPPQMIPVVQIDPLDHDRQVRAKAAPLLEAAKHLVVVFHEPQPDL